MYVYRNELGVIGNLKALIKEFNKTSDATINNKASYDVFKDNYDVEHLDNEQQATESYLNLVEAQQNITDLQLQIWELGGN